MKPRYRMAYVSRVIYPKRAAHALQTMRMAAAFADGGADTRLFVRGLMAPREQIYQQYGIDGSPLKIWSLHADRLPSCLRGPYSRPRVYNSVIAALLGLHPAWWGGAGAINVFFVRGVQDFAPWGLMRPYLWWLRKWIFVYEAHDTAGLDLSPEGPGQAPANRAMLGALHHYDLVLCVTQALADYLRRWSQDRLQPQVVRHASALPRLPRAPDPTLQGDRVVLGYVGTIDRERGVDSLLAAMRWLPENVSLRLVGRVPGQGAGNRPPVWLADLLREPKIGERVELVLPVPIGQVAGEIDRCDILLQPASEDIISLRYRAPLKLFDYMVRGKPIVAADVPCHRELVQDGVNAYLYRYDDPQHLAGRVMALVENPQQAKALSERAWQQSIDYSYEARAKQILDLVDETFERRNAK